MRARLLALSLLFLVIFLLGGLYWYFYTEKVASIVFLPSRDDIDFTVSLEGKLEYTYFPLLDKVFAYKSTCRSACILSPIPPLRYDVHIEIAGRDPIDTVIELPIGEQIRYDIEIGRILEILPERTLSSPDRMSSIEGYRTIGMSESDKPIVERLSDPREVGILQSGRFLPIAGILIGSEDLSVEATRQYIIATTLARERYIHPIDGQGGVIFPFDSDIISLPSRDPWRVRTGSGLYEQRGDRWEINPRFTDLIDLSERYRLGYLDPSDQEKYTVANIPEKEPLIILLDRVTGKSEIIKKGIIVKSFFKKGDLSYMIGADDSVSKLRLTE